MSVQLDNQVEQHYETLPELLSDLSKMIQKNPEQSNPNGGCQWWNKYSSCGWFATIDCSGDYHNLYFSSGGNRHIKPNDSISHTFENLDSLYTELEYIREFLSTQEIGNFDLTYEIISNGGKPFLRVYLSGVPSYSPQENQNMTEDVLPPPPPSRWWQLIPRAEEVRGVLLVVSVIIPTFYVLDKLRN